MVQQVARMQNVVHSRDQVTVQWIMCAYNDQMILGKEQNLADTVNTVIVYRFLAIEHYGT